MSEISDLTGNSEKGVHITSITVRKSVHEPKNKEKTVSEMNASDNNNESAMQTEEKQDDINLDENLKNVEQNLTTEAKDNSSTNTNNVIEVEKQSNKKLNTLFEAESLWTTQRDGAVRLRMTEKGGGSESPQTVVALLQQTRDRIPNNAALCVKRDGSWQKWTYTQYYNDVCRAAKSFIKLGLKPYHGVGILGFNSPEWFIADLGCIFAGGFAVGIYTTNNAEACQFVAFDCKANIIVVENKQQLQKILKIRANLPELKAIVQYIGEVEEPEENVYDWKTFMELGEDVPDTELEKRFQSLAPNKCCTLIYTSGTTGQPKGVMLSHDNLTWTPINTVRLAHLVFGVERLVSYLPLSHVAAQVLDIYLPMYHGATVFFAQPDALKGSLVFTLREVRPTGFLGVPRVWEKMQEKMKEVGKNNTGIKLKIANWAKSIGIRGNKNLIEGKSVPFGWFFANNLVFKRVKENLGLDQCKIMFSGAAPITKETLEYFMCLDLVVDEVYGMSESTGPHTFSRIGCRRVTSVGKEYPGSFTRLENTDEEGNGEICMYGRHVFMGYLQQEEKTREVFTEDGWLKTGDIGKKDSDGFLFITGRIKELIITAGGENIAPVPVEDAVKEALGVISNCMLIGDKKKFLSMFLTLKCEVNQETQAPLDNLTDEAKQWCKSIGSSAETISEILEKKDAAVMKAIQEGIEKANKKAVSRAAVIQKWIILPRDFSIDGGELGPTLKLRRPIVVKMYQKEIDAFYAD